MSYTIQLNQRVATGTLIRASQCWDGSWYIGVDVHAEEWGNNLLFGFCVPTVGNHEIGDTITVIEEFNTKCRILEEE